jgi:hypothetical protein
VIYRKNLYALEQVCRVVLGLNLAVAACWTLSTGLLGYILAASGVILVITGVVGFCPMCAMAGRRPAASGPVGG